MRKRRTCDSSSGFGFFAMHIIYVDDSKDEKLACFSALAVPADSWHVTLDRFISLRRILRETEGVPIRFEFHATDWLGGKGWFDKPIRRPDRVRIYDYLLAGVAMMPGIQLFNAAVPQHKEDIAFERLLNRINVNMRKSSSHAIIITDQGKDYTKMLRRLRRYNPVQSKYGAWDGGAATKNLVLDRILEDIVFRDSRHSLFIQAADLCGYALLRRENPLRSKTALGLHYSMFILERIMVKAAFGSDPLGIIRAT